MTLIYKINDLEKQIPYKKWEALKQEFVEFAKEKRQLEQENQRLKSVLNEVKEYVTNDLKNFERLINTSPTPSFYQLPYGVCVSVLNKIEEGGSNG